MLMLLLLCGAVSITINLWLMEWTLVSSPQTTTESHSSHIIDTSQQRHHGFNEKPFTKTSSSNSSSSNNCWSTWNDFQNDPKKFLPNSYFSKKDLTVVWSVSGGTEYRNSMEMLLTSWKEIYQNDPGVILLLVALDSETFDTACAIHGISSTIYWDISAQSYSKVADVKMGVAAYLSQEGYVQLFIELDVFCRTSPLPVSIHALDQHGSADLAVLGHAHFQSKINIGMYYVRPSSKATTFFQTLVEILSASSTQEKYITKDGQTISYFDQGIFEMCLQMSLQKPMEIYALSDTGHTKNLLESCNHHHLQYALISNLYISSYQPPTVYDSTICVHPLSNQPFSSFQTKLATAKFLGFDPMPALRDPNTRPLLKTIAGDLTITDSPDSALFFGGDFHKLPILQRTVQYPLAAMIYFATLTNRTLILPRHVRNTNTKAFPLFSLVNTASIEAMGVSWRYLTIEEARQLESTTTIVTIQQQVTLMDAISIILDACSTNSMTHHETLHDNNFVTHVCSIHGLETVISHLYLEETPETTGSPWKQILDPIVGNLTWCLKPPNLGSLFSFSIGAGHMERPCTGVE
jgi:hypothetical protein